MKFVSIVIPFTALNALSCAFAQNCYTGTPTAVNNWCRSNNCCNGPDACSGWSSSSQYTLCSGSCNALYACHGIAKNANSVQIKIGSNSCSANEEEPCANMAKYSSTSVITVEDNSCNGKQACTGVAEESRNLKILTFYSGSCNGFRACVLREQLATDLEFLTFTGNSHSKDEPPDAGGGGDPHFSAFGGISFSWQGHCDAILARISGQNDNDDTTKISLEIQIRTRKVRSWSAIDVVAVQVGRHVLEIGSEEGKLLLNGSEVETVNEDSLIVSSTRLKKRMVLYQFMFKGDKKLEVKVNTRSRMIFVRLSGNYPKETVGLVGSPRRQGLFARGGRDMTGKDVNEFVESWQVRDDDPQLFLTARAPQYPAKCLYSIRKVRDSATAVVRRSSQSRYDRHRRLKEISGAVTAEEANEACATHNQGPLKAFCVEDVIATGDFESAQDEFYG